MVDWPRSAMSISTQSSTVRAIGPIVSSVRESGNTPRLSIRPSLVLNPTMPQKLAGARIEPPVSLPIAQGARPAATATAAPDEDPPAMRGVTGSRGFLGVPKCGLSPRRRESEFREIGFPQRHETGRGQVCDDRRVVLLRRRFGEQRRPGGGALARHVDKVLPGDWHAVERPCRASLTVTLPACRRFRESPLAGDENERWISAIALDAIEEEFRNLDRVEPAFGDEPSDRRGGALFQVVDHVAISLRPSDRIAARAGKRQGAWPGNGASGRRPRRSSNRGRRPIRDPLVIHLQKKPDLNCRRRRRSCEPWAHSSFWRLLSHLARRPSPPTRFRRAARRSLRPIRSAARP